MSDLYDNLRERGCMDGALLRPMISSQIGKDCPFKTKQAAANHYGIHVEQLSAFLLGKRPAEPKLLAAMGLEKVVLYAPAIERSQHLNRNGVVK